MAWLCRRPPSPATCRRSRTASCRGTTCHDAGGRKLSIRGRRPGLLRGRGLEVPKKHSRAAPPKLHSLAEDAAAYDYGQPAATMPQSRPRSKPARRNAPGRSALCPDKSYTPTRVVLTQRHTPPIMIWAGPFHRAHE
jgi:hypothetical protein